LAEELALRRVDVLAAERVVLAQLARLEADDAAARIAEREHEPPLEVVAAAAADQARGSELRLAESSLAGLAHQLTAPRRQTEPELPPPLLVQTAAREIAAYRRPGRALPQTSFVERRRLLEQGVQALASPARGIGCRRGFLVLDGNVEALCEPFDRADEVDPFGLLDEADRVAPGAAAEPVIRAGLGGH